MSILKNKKTNTRKEQINNYHNKLLSYNTNSYLFNIAR